MYCPILGSIIAIENPVGMCDLGAGLGFLLLLVDLFLYLQNVVR